MSADPALPGREAAGANSAAVIVSMELDGRPSLISMTTIFGTGRTMRR